MYNLDLFFAHIDETQHQSNNFLAFTEKAHGQHKQRYFKPLF